ncbi:hypothetical protein DTO217A2_4638 [Paecilomyces variotii]|nr:hypothetical protein DTO217A2_4638 [Paecilomyces variotii]
MQQQTRNSNRSPSPIRRNISRSSESNADYDPTYGIRSGHNFETRQKFTRFLEQSYKRFESSGGPQYVMARGINKKVLDWLDSRRRTLPPMRVSHDEIEEKLIIKLVSRQHEALHRIFMHFVCKELENMGVKMLDDFWLEGAGREEGRQSRKKEPDDSFKPLNTRPKFEDSPTFVIEAGLNGTLNKLRNDAFYWLTQTSQRVRIVVLIHGFTERKVITIEVWQSLDNPRPRRTRSAARSKRPTKTQTLTIRKRDNSPPIVTGAPLLLPVDALFEIVPPSVTQNAVSLSAQILEMYAGPIFNSMQ